MKSFSQMDNRRCLLLSLWVIGLDQLAKWWIVRSLPAFEVRPLMPHLNLVFLHNTGAAFSMFRHAPAETFILLAGIASVGILVWFWRHGRGQLLLATSFALILGGAIGNAIDRITRGYVVDFVDFYVGTWHFAAFNVADSAISVGAALLLLEVVLQRPQATGPAGS